MAVGNRFTGSAELKRSSKKLLLPTCGKRGFERIFFGGAGSAGGLQEYSPNPFVDPFVVEVADGTASKAGLEEFATGFIYFQSHGNPVAFRNVWLIEK
jgi:hypothetical protein